jgi:hypothetical protein
MDLYETIQQLKAQKEKIEHAIAQLEQLHGTGDHTNSRLASPKRRGRKSMGAEERKEVALRMKRYWADRRGLAASEGPAGV